MREGYIKFNVSWDQEPFRFNDLDFNLINSYRQRLFNLGLVGSYPDGIGFGNLSIRQINNEFIISGSATGNIPNLTKKKYSLVKEFDIKNNSVTCQGLSKASSESLSHAAVYQKNPKVNAVIHVHQKNMWNCYQNKLPTTNRKAKFGTPEIASELSRVSHPTSGIIVMGGHPEGIITYGKSLEEAYHILLNYYNNL